MNALQDLLQKYSAEITAYNVGNAEELEQYRIYFLGTKGVVKNAMAAMKDVPGPQKKEAGLLLNAFKISAEEKYNTAKEQFGEDNSANKDALLDLTLPGKIQEVGAVHPLHSTLQKMIDVLQRIGFTVTEGPEIEDDWHNFSALNLPEDHPARDMQDTFYINTDPAVLLRTHTSSVQVRVMEDGDLPIRQIFPGRVYRNETISARAHCFFHQVEGLYIDKGVSFADLKQTLYYFVQELFGHLTSELKVRFRPSYFPFTEPSAEMDISCFICNGDGCNVCKHSGWVEILGCGMVHPNVLDNCNIDSQEYTGFAWGMGVERITMMLYGIKDLRLLSENDIRLLSQFKGVQ
jgi:phenylalanyl-tRNA synthetase alpha chain